MAMVVSEHHCSTQNVAKLEEMGSQPKRKEMPFLNQKIKKERERVHIIID